jgi:predicted anti-sigma-YlaC factor YlaD
MNCKAAQEIFDDRLDERLDTATQAAFDAHVAACASCGAAWREYAGVWATVARHVAAEPSVGFAERTLRRLDEPTAAPERASQWLAPLWRWALATSLVVMLGGAGWLGWERTHARRAEKQTEAYVMASQDRLDDFDVIASLHLLNGENRNEKNSVH